MVETFSIDYFNYYVGNTISNVFGENYTLNADGKNIDIIPNDFAGNVVLSFFNGDYTSKRHYHSNGTDITFSHEERES